MDDSITVSQAQKAFAEQYPSLYRRVYPRAYQPVRDYAGSKNLALHLGMSLAGVTRAGYDHVARVVRDGALIASRFVALDAPTYYVERDILHAALATEPPDLSWVEFPLPFEALVFCLPPVIATRDGGVNAIALARLEAGINVLPGEQSNEDWRVDLAHDVLAIYYVTAGRGVACSLTLNAKDAPRVRDVALAAGESIGCGPDGSPTFSPISPGDENEIHGLLKLAWNLCAVMMARPELVEGRLMLAPSSDNEKRAKNGTVWAAPRWVGRHYRVQVDPGLPPAGTHASPRLHWRRGHYASQPYGPRRTQRKIIWREPVLVGSAEGHSATQ